jgi:hypothetical protein
MGLLGSSNEKLKPIKADEKLPKKIDYRLINYANLLGENGDITYYNNSILQNPKNIIAMIKRFKQEIEVLEFLLDEMGAEDMYAQKLEDFDPEAYKENIKESGEIQGIDLENLT